MQWLILLILIIPIVMGAAKRRRNNQKLREKIQTHLLLFPEMSRGKTLRQIITYFCALHTEFESKYYNLYTKEELSQIIKL